MTKETSVNKLSYPEDTDVPNAPAQLKSLAETLDTLKWGSRNLKPTIGVVYSTADVSLGTSYADITGLSITVEPAVTSKLLVVASFRMKAVSPPASGGPAFPEASIKVDSEEESTNVGSVEVAEGTTGKPDYAVQMYAVSLASGSHTIKGRGKRNTAGTGSEVKKGSALLYALFAS